MPSSPFAWIGLLKSFLLAPLVQRVRVSLPQLFQAEDVSTGYVHFFNILRALQNCVNVPQKVLFSSAGHTILLELISESSGCQALWMPAKHYPDSLCETNLIWNQFLW